MQKSGYLLQRPAHTSFQVSRHSLDDAFNDFFLVLRYQADEGTLAVFTIQGPGNDTSLVSFDDSLYNSRRCGKVTVMQVAKFSLK